MGYIQIDRNICNNWIWQQKPFSYGQAWIDLLILANWKDKKKLFRNKITISKRGEIDLSILFLSDRWGWDRKKTRKFLTILENDEMITLNGTTNGTNIRITNYNIYQQKIEIEGQQKAQQTEQKKDNGWGNDSPYINKDKKNNKKDKNIYGVFNNVLLTNDEYSKLKNTFIDYQEKIDDLSSYLASKGDKYKSHYATILNWARKDKQTTPTWFNKEIKQKERSEEDERELQELIRGY